MFLKPPSKRIGMLSVNSEQSSSNASTEYTSTGHQEIY